MISGCASVPRYLRLGLSKKTYWSRLLRTNNPEHWTLTLTHLDPFQPCRWKYHRHWPLLPDPGELSCLRTFPSTFALQLFSNDLGKNPRAVEEKMIILRLVSYKSYGMFIWVELHTTNYLDDWWITTHNHMINHNISMQLNQMSCGDMRDMGACNQGWRNNRQNRQNTLDVRGHDDFCALRWNGVWSACQNPKRLELYHVLVQDT